ncbi:MAG: diacylglycerol kinase family protein [Trueperaceae bacterium]
MFKNKRISVILNPSSGTESADGLSDLVREALRAGGATEVLLRLTTGAADAGNWAKEAGDEGFDVVIAGGGDGTVTDVAHGVLLSAGSPVIGIIPLGTGNGMARILGLALDPKQSLEAMQHGKIVTLDALDVVSHDTTCLMFLGAGLDAEINRDADAEEKTRLGFLAYVKATFSNLFGRQNRPVTLVVDGHERHILAHTVNVFNATHLAVLGFDVGPDAHPHDGVAELSVMSSPGFWPLVGQLLSIAGRKTSKPELEPVHTLKLTAEPPMLLQVDGDVIGETPVEVKILPAALSFIADHSYEIPE